MRKFQKLVEVQSLHSEPISPQSKLTSFYTDLRKTASMYKDFWEELSTHFPNILVVSQKAHDLYYKAQHVRQQWENIGPEFDPHSEIAHTYNYFRLNVLYDEKEQTSENTNGYNWSPDNHKNSRMSLKVGNSLDHKGKLSKEDDGALISTIVKSLYEEKKGRGYSVPLRFNGREDFTEFLGDNKLPSRVLRKKKEVIATSLCPYLFMIILVILSLTRNITSSFDTFDTQYQRNLITADLHSEINDVFEWKDGILNTSIDAIKSSIHQNLNLLESLENKMILPSVTQKSLRSYAKNNISLWTPAMTKNTTELMMQKANAFVEIETDKLTKDDPNYLFWANNMQGEYYQGLLNWNQLMYNDLKEYSETMPFNTLMGLLFFLCTFAIIFLNLLNIYKLIALGNDAMNIYLSISQPELDALKAKCQTFLDYLETLDAKKNGEEAMGIEDKPLRVRQIHPGLQQRVRIKPLKQYKKPRTELESRICSTIMLLIAVSFLFIIPIPFQRKYKVLVDQQMEDFSNITDLETSFSFSYNTLKQQLIQKTSVFEYENATIPLKLSHDKLLQIAQQLKGNKFQDFMTGEFCHTLNGQVQERCARFAEGKVNSGAKSILNKKLESLQEITNEYNKLLENKDSNTESSNAVQLLRKMEELNLNSFREDFLKPGLQILRNSYPELIEKTFKETLQMAIVYDIIAILLWTAVIFVLFYRVMRPLYRFVEARKKLIRLIPFPLLMNMKDEVIGFIWTYCELPTHDTRTRSADSV